MNERALTLDVDWAPDWAIDFCISECLKANIPSTIFITHESPVVSSLRGEPNVELGIHPNFQPGSTQGSDVAEVFATLTGIEPQARSMRTHSLAQSSPILEYAATFAQIRNDVSLFLPFSRELPITSLRFPESTLTRLPYSWEDDLVMNNADWDWSLETWPGEVQGRVVWDFHPIHIVLNSTGFHQYASLKEYLGIRPLHELKESEAKQFRNNGTGTLTYFRQLLRRKEWNWMTICDICDGGSDGK